MRGPTRNQHATARDSSIPNKQGEKWRPVGTVCQPSSGGSTLDHSAQRPSASAPAGRDRGHDLATITAIDPKIAVERSEGSRAPTSWGNLRTRGPPLPRRCPFPLLKRAEERVRVFVAEEICGLVQLEGGVLEVMACELAARFASQLLEGDALVGQAA